MQFIRDVSGVWGGFGLKPGDIDCSLTNNPTALPIGGNLNHACLASRFHNSRCLCGLRSLARGDARVSGSGETEMVLNLAKVVMITSALLLSACSGMSSSTCFSEGCQSFDGHSAGNNATKVSFGGSAIGSSFSQYSSGLLHDD